MGKQNDILITCHDCIYHTAYVDGQICPLFQIGMCDASTRKYFTPKEKVEGE